MNQNRALIRLSFSVCGGHPVAIWMLGVPPVEDHVAGCLSDGSYKRGKLNLQS